MRNARYAVLLLAVITFALPSLAATYGKPLSKEKAVKVSDLLAKPDEFVGKTVKVEGIVTDVCEMRGCWMVIAGDQDFQSIRFKVEDGVIVIPMEAKGKKAVAEGTFRKIEMSKEQTLEQAKHHAEETGQPFDPEKVKGPSVIYQLDGTGAVID